jgi:hypothetical protein
MGQLLGAEAFYPSCGADKTRLELKILLASDTAEYSLLNCAENLGLQVQIQVADLIEKQRAIGGFLEVANASRLGIGECPRLVAEERRLNQAGWYGGSVDRDPGLRCRRTKFMYCACQQVLACAAFTDYPSSGTPRGGRPPVPRNSDNLYYQSYTHKSLWRKGLDE